MRNYRVSCLIFIISLFCGGNILAGAETPAFKFPTLILYKLVQKAAIMGECTLSYEYESNQEGISGLKLTNFQGMGRSSNETFHTYLFSKNYSLYAAIVKKGGKTIQEIRLKDGINFEYKKEKVFVYKDAKQPGLQTELFTQFPVIDLLSSIFIVSQRVSSGEYKKKAPYNFIFNQSTKIAEISYAGQGTAPFLGKNITTEILLISIRDVEMFRMYVYKDPEGFYFPVSITISGDSGTLEMRADRVVNH